MPNPDGSMTDDEMRALTGNLASHPPPIPVSTSTYKALGDYAPDEYGVTYGMNSQLGQQAATDWAQDQAANKPWLTQGQAARDTRNNFYYGGSKTGATDFNAGLAHTGDQLGTGFTQIQGGAGQLGAQAAAMQAGSQNAMGAAQQRDPAAFIDRTSYANNGFDRAAQVNSMEQLAQFAQQGQGPSAAQAQLNQASDANMMNSLAMARSGRGMGQSQSAMRQAIGQNAVTGQQAANQSAALAAQEYQQYQQNKLNALGSMGGIAGQARQGDVQLGSYVSGTAQAGRSAADQAALGYGQQSLGYGQQQLAAGQLGLGAQQANAANALGFSGLQNDVNKSSLNGSSNYETQLENSYLGYLNKNATTKGTDYTPYLAAAGAALGSLVGPAGTAAGGAIGGAIGSGVSSG